MLRKVGQVPGLSTIALRIESRESVGELAKLIAAKRRSRKGNAQD